MMSSAVIDDDSFIVPDEAEDDYEITSNFELPGKIVSGRQTNSIDLTIDARPMFDIAFGSNNDSTSSIQLAKSQTISEYIEKILQEIETKKNREAQGIVPL